MKNLNQLFTESYNDVVAAGLTPGKILNVTINSRAKKRWGLCRLQNGYFSIEISNRLLDDNVDDIATKNTIVHEILHTCPNCMNHGKEWQYNADIINNHYKGYYNISRTTSAEDKGLEPLGRVRNDSVKYTLVCTGCGRKIYYKRASKAIQAPQNYRCGYCRGRFEVFAVN